MDSLERSFTNAAKKVMGVGAAIVAVLYLSDWLYAVSFYEALGVASLARVEFPLIPAPIPLAGGVVLLVAFTGIAWGGVSAVGSLWILKTIFLKATKKSVSRKEEMFTWALWTIFLSSAYLLINVSRGMEIGEPETEAIKSIDLFLSITSGGVSIWAGSKYFWGKKISHWIRDVLIVVILVSLFKFLLIDLSQALGTHAAREILLGESHLPTVAVLSDVKLRVSDGVIEREIDENVWEYYPQLVEHPISHKKLPTLQLVGKDKTHVYFLDVWAGKNYSISLNHVLEIVYLHSLEDVPDMGGTTP